MDKNNLNKCDGRISKNLIDNILTEKNKYLNKYFTKFSFVILF